VLPGQLNDPAKQATDKLQAVSLSAVTRTTCIDNNSAEGSSAVEKKGSYILSEAMTLYKVY
jgi:hypothetical protein